MKNKETILKRDKNSTRWNHSTCLRLQHILFLSSAFSFTITHDRALLLPFPLPPSQLRFFLVTRLGLPVLEDLIAD